MLYEVITHDVGLTIGASSTDIGADALLPTRDNLRVGQCFGDVVRNNFV